MKTENKMRVILSATSVLLVIIAVVMASFSFSFSVSADDDAPEIRGTLTETIAKTEENAELLKTFTSETPYYIVVKHKHLGGSHYAYTDALFETYNTEDMYKEYNFNPGSSMVLLTAVDRGDTVEIYEETLLESETGVIRDPDVSSDGKRVLFSHKEDQKDDYHIYEMVIDTKEITQLTFGSGKSDIEAKYLPNGKILFNSNRCVQTVDCWVTPVLNFYIMNGDGTGAIRVGYDQVHTTYPTVTSDGRVIYTRWDYNDRTQMWVQGLFQMFQDGSNQTELYGNSSNFPTTLLHTREIPGARGKYISIASGHHSYQQGKVVVVDTNEGRDNPDAITYLIEQDSSFGKPENVDGGSYVSEGTVYKYPYAFNESEFLVAASSAYAAEKTVFHIYLMNDEGVSVAIAQATGEQTPSQIVPVKGGTPFNRPSSLNYAANSGTYYVADVYAGESMEGVERGTVKYLRVVALEYRTTAIGATSQMGSGGSDAFTPIAVGNGAWDVKAVLGIVPVEEDGSCMFRVPAETPVYFQLLDKDGQMIQTMRSWSTLMPGETYSCVGCHEDNNTTPLGNANVTSAMKRGVQDLSPDMWMGLFEEYENYDPYKDDLIGFSYLNTVQRVWDRNCVACHSNTDESVGRIDGMTVPQMADDLVNANYLIKPSDWWTYIEEGGKSGTAYAPFGAITTSQTDINTPYSGDKITLTKSINVTKYDVEACEITLWLNYSGTIDVRINETSVYTSSKTALGEEVVVLNNENFTIGENTVVVEVSGGTKYVNLSMTAAVPATSNLGAVNTTAVFSLEGHPISAQRMRKTFPLSYLVLTDATPIDTGELNWVGNVENDYITWVSSMSDPKIQKPYEAGSTKSQLIEKLASGHCATITAEELAAIKCWIDLSVPCYGEYDDCITFSHTTLRQYTESVNKRAYYDAIDRYNKLIMAGLAPDKEVKISFTAGSETLEASGVGLATLYVDAIYEEGNTVTVTLPEGERYVYICLNSRAGEVLMYLPTGTWTYEFESLTLCYPSTMNYKKQIAYIENTITARIPTAEELAETRNLASNIYDLSAVKDAYPHASSSSAITGAQFAARNAIDGFRTNVKAAAKWPNNAWAAETTETSSDITIDFGRNVVAEELVIFITDDDTHYVTAIVVLSDGTEMEINLRDTAEGMRFNLGGKTTSSITIKNLIKADAEKTAAISEIQVFGYEA